MKQEVIIAGGGLSGLTLAYLLQKEGIDCILLEARDRLGGRILTAGADGNPSADGFDLGPSWFWPEVQQSLAKLVQSLGLQTIVQHSRGDVLFHRMSRELPRRFSPAGQDQVSMRIAGGTGALITALAAALPEHKLRLETRVIEVETAPDRVVITAVDREGRPERLEASKAVFAIPPRLLQATIRFDPQIDATTADRWRNTPTWMAPHAKFFAIYDRPFRREAGLSGTAQSLAGPMVEIHDATTASGKPALFGFLGIPASARAQLGDDRLVEACLAQLALLFGPDAAEPVATLFKDWARDPLTATEADVAAVGHPPAGDEPWITEAFRGRILLAGSETSPLEPGYLAGAVEAALRAFEEIKELKKSQVTGVRR